MKKNGLKRKIKCPQIILSLELLNKSFIYFPCLPLQFQLWRGVSMVCTGLQWACLQQAFALEQHNFDASPPLSPVASHWFGSLRGFGMLQTEFLSEETELGAPVQMSSMISRSKMHLRWKFWWIKTGSDGF